MMAAPEATASDHHPAETGEEKRQAAHGA
jgi:hypothetical protein